MDRGHQLLPVPPRPARSTDVDRAAGHVERALPQLEARAARALALVELAGRTPVEAAAALAASEGAVRDLLYRARKELRRSSFPLSATGWCERAERLLSDRLDAPLDGRGAGRIESHLRNCGRCVEHERRLASARVALVEGFLAQHGAAQVALVEVDAPAAEAALRAVEPPRTDARPQAESEPVAPNPVAQPAPSAAPPEPARHEPADDEPAPLIALPRRESPARPAAALAALTAGGAWYALSVVSVILAVLSVIVTMLGVVGVDRLL